MIRSHGGRNINPTPSQFQNSFKSLLINNLTCAKTVRGNCEDDNAMPLFSLRNMALIAQNAEETMMIVQSEPNSDPYMLFSNNDCNETGTCIDTSAILRSLYSDDEFKRCCFCISELYNFNILNTVFKEAHILLEANIDIFCFKKRSFKKFDSAVVRGIGLIIHNVYRTF